MELESLICGELMNEDDWSEDKLRSFFKAGHGYTSENMHYSNFIKYLKELEKDSR